jgi:hypothetical protein
VYVYCGLNFMLACKAGTLPFEPHLQSVLLWLLLEMGSLWTSVPQSSASQVARVTGVSHQHQVYFIFWQKNKLPSKKGSDWEWNFHCNT